MSSNYFKDKRKNSSLELLQQYKKMFDATIYKYVDSDYNIESKEDTKTIHEPTLKKEVNKLIKIGVLK